MAARHGALAEAAAALGDLASAEALRSVATGAAGPLPAGRHPALTADAVVPAAAGAFDLLRAALVQGTLAWGPLVTLTVWGALAVVLARRLLRWSD